MENVPISILDVTHSTDGPPGEAKPIPVTEEGRTIVRMYMRERLLHADRPQPLVFHYEPHEPIGVRVERSDTAASVTWSIERKGQLPILEAVSALLSGLDAREDRDAVNRLKDIRPRLLFEPEEYDRALEQPRPALVNMYLDRRFLEAGIVRFAAITMAEMFFNEFGGAFKPLE